MDLRMGGALAAAGLMLLKPGTVSQAACRACALWAEAVLPNLLPFLVCLTYAAGRLPIPEGKGCRVTGLSRFGRRVMLMGWLTGSPGGARLMGEAAARGCLSPADGLRLALWGGSMSPMFLMGTLPVWCARPVGLKLLAAHLAGVFAAGQMARLLPVRPCPSLKGAPPPPMTLSRAIDSACRALLTVCGCMVMGCVAGALMRECLPGLSPMAGALFQCLAEVTAGCRELLEAGAPVWALPGAVSLGGLSLFLQNMAFWPRDWFSPGWVLGGRLIACGVSLGVGWLLLGSAKAPVFAAFGQAPVTVNLWPMVFILLVCCGIMKPL